VEEAASANAPQAAGARGGGVGLVPDGKTLAYTDGTGQLTCFRREPTQSVLARRRKARGQTRWSADGRQIAYAVGRRAASATPSTRHPGGGRVNGRPPSRRIVATPAAGPAAGSGGVAEAEPAGNLTPWQNAGSHATLYSIDLIRRQPRRWRLTRWPRDWRAGVSADSVSPP